MEEKINIVFVVPSLVAGGAERIMSFISQNLDPQKFNTKLLVAGFEIDTVYDINNVDVVYLNKSRVLLAIPSFFFFFIRNKTDIVISSMSHLNIALGYLSIFFRKIKFIGREATVPSIDNFIKNADNKIKNKKRSLLNILNVRMYNQLDLIVCQSKDMAKDIQSYFNIPYDKIKIINNPISNIAPLIQKTKHKKIRLITVGRLSKEKGHLRIIKLLPKLEFDFSYTIIGDGDEKDKIFSEAKRLGIYHKIKHISFTKEIHQILSTHDMFIQGSYVEGFPNALLESCVAGIPVVAFDAPGGTKEIIEHGINGFLVKTEEEFVRTLHKKVEWEPSKIRNSVIVKFNKEKIINEYQEMFVKLITN